MEKAKIQAALPIPDVIRPLWQNAVFFAAMIGILVFANFGNPETTTGIWHAIYSSKWSLASAFAILFSIMLASWFNLRWIKVIFAIVSVIASAVIFPHTPLITFTVGVIGLSVIISKDEGEAGEWFNASWGFAKQILPLLLFGVLISGLLLGRPGHEGLIPSEWISSLVGGNSILSNFIASFIGAFMYFATLTEIPILQGLIGSGMGKGPALALLLAGPALSLPSMLVIRTVIGTQKTIVFVSLVIVMATISGLIYGTFF
jgi:uncharacterized membrane protein YraQ (UPF0718 family)